MSGHKLFSGQPASNITRKLIGVPSVLVPSVSCEALAKRRFVRTRLLAETNQSIELEDSLEADSPKSQTALVDYPTFVYSAHIVDLHCTETNGPTFSGPLKPARRAAFGKPLGAEAEKMSSHIFGVRWPAASVPVRKLLI